MTDVIVTAESAAELVKKNQADVMDVIKELKTGEPNVEGLKLIGEAEAAKKKPRSGVLEACGVTVDDDKTEDGEKKEVVETLSAAKPFNMVFTKDGFKHYFQEGRIYDRATKERRKDLEPKGDK